MKNIILTGMPGCGKSTVGVVLAKTLGMQFVDTDLIIQRQNHDVLWHLIDRYGIKRFEEMEEEALLSVTETEDTVIATGGSAVFCERGMKFLKQTGICVYLEVPCDELKRRLNNIKTRGIAAAKGMTIEDIFAERSPYYEKYADLRIDCLDRNIEEITEIIASGAGDLNG
ncbi:MAG TPA: shikimate kinase [Ruminococcaceae bacterium]|nr:shikimate kinase [Oscillospiraceae bacterium]